MSKSGKAYCTTNQRKNNLPLKIIVESCYHLIIYWYLIKLQSLLGSRYGRRSNWFKLHCILQNDHPKFKSGQIEKQLENDIQLQNVSTTTESPGGVDSSKVSLSPISSPSIVYPTPSTLPDHNSFQTAFTMGINWPPVAYIQGPKIIPTSATYSPHQHSSLVSPLNPHAIRMPSMPISVIKTSPINLGDNKKIWRPPVDSKLWVSPTVSTNETPLDLSLKPLRKLDNVESSPLDLRKK